MPRSRLTLALVVALRLGIPLDASAGGPSDPPTSRAGDAHLPVLTSLQAIRALSQDEGAKGYPVRVRGTVTHFDELHKSGLIVHDGAFGQYVVDPSAAEALRVWRELRRGDVVEIEGYTVRGGFAPNVMPTRLWRLGRAPLPPPKRIPYSRLLTGRHDCDYVEIEGVVQRTWMSSDPEMRAMFADVATEEGVVRAWFWSHAPGDLVRLIDARVRLRGNAGTIFGATEQLRGVSLFGGRTSEVTLLDPPPDPFSRPLRPIGSIYHYSLAGEVNRRIRVRGVATAYIAGRPVEVYDFTSRARFRYVNHVLYVRDDTGAVRIETEQGLPVRPGQLVEAAGFAAPSPGKPILRNAVFRVVGAAAQPAPVYVPPGRALAPENDAELVRMEGQFLGLLTTAAERVLVIKAGEAAFHAGLEVDRSGGALDEIRPGSLVTVTGVYSYQHGPPPSFRLHLRSPDDVVVTAPAPWWTMRHSLVMLATLGLGGALVAVWVRATARRRRQQYQAVLTERNRVARELHDTLEQGLSGLALQLEAVAARLEATPEEARQSLEVARQMLRYSLEETRRSVMDLRAQALESRDLAGALSLLARQMTLGTPTRAEVRVEGPRERLDAAEEHHLLRIGLEALTNALKHAGATEVVIDLRFTGREVELAVRDNGRGLGHGVDEIPGTHFGLQGIRERVNKLGGTLRIDSLPGRGTRLAVTVPARRRAAERPARLPLPALVRRLRHG
ncbi:MAG TPA: histidine kinase [Vicinamibacterales bacterium]|nr:histidine kinase [Vicinamibacterales bacterium]